MPNETAYGSPCCSAASRRQSLAEELDVDPKTVERWVTKGRLPYRKTRFAVAAKLGVDEAVLWPGALSADQVAAASSERDRRPLPAPVGGAAGHLGPAVRRGPG